MSGFDDAPTLPDGEVRPGQILGGRYRLDEQRGGQGEIAFWAGWDETLSRAVSIYVLPPNHPRTDALLGAARQAATATDPRFLRVLDALEFGPSEPVSFIVCEDLPGLSLQNLLRRGPLSNLGAAWLVGEVATALAPLHEAGLGHGALSPATVLVTPSGAVRIKGFMLDAALAGRENDAPAERERHDVAAIGRLLYACLTGAWPDADTPTPPRTYGLPPAQWRDDCLVSPAQARPGVSPVLAAICLQTLQPRPGAAPLRTAAAVSLALRRVLGAADGSAELAARVNAVIGPAEVDGTDEIGGTNDLTAGEVTVDLPPVERPATPPPPVNGAVTSATQMLGPDAAGPTEPQPPPQPPGTPGVASVGVFRHAAILGGDSGWAGKLRRLPGWAWLVPLVVVVLVVVLIVRSCTASPTPPPVLSLAAITELDSKTDGGNGQDNPDLVPLASDGRDDTCWLSEDYSPTFIPSRKPGIGLIFDLGQALPLGSLTLILGTTPDNISVMVPSGDAGSVDTPPLDTVHSWNSLADVTADASPFTVNLPVTTTRFVMLYFTSLAPVPGKDGHVQASVCEVTATG